MCCNEGHGHHHGLHHGGHCDCGGGHHGERGHDDCREHHGGHECCCCEGEQSRHFPRRFHTREERLAWLEEYLKDLQAEVKAVQEQIAELKATQ